MLNWDYNVFNKKNKNFIIGWDILGSFNSFGKGKYVDSWMCMWIRSKNFKLLKSTIQLVKFFENEKYYVNYFYYLGHLYKSKVIGMTYIKIVNCSRLVKKRLKW